MTGAELITQERTRQILACGWTPEHDDTQKQGELLECAIAVATGVRLGYDFPTEDASPKWQWQRAAHVQTKYGKDHIRRLAIAGALIAAEIDRLQREKAKGETS